MDNQNKITADPIMRTRLLLLAACFSISAATAVACVILLLEYFMEIPERIKGLILIPQIILVMTGIAQVVYNERLLRPIARFISPDKDLDVKKISYATFVIFTGMFLIAFLIIRIFALSQVSFLLYAAITLAGAFTAVGMLVFFLKGTGSGEIDGGQAVDAVMKLPLKSSLFSLLLWILVGPMMGLFFYSIVGVSFLTTTAISLLVFFAGILAFPMQYMIFKRVTGDLKEILLEKGLGSESRGFRITIRQKLTVGIASVAVFTVGFYGLLNFMKANRIMHEQAAQFLEKLLQKTGGNVGNILEDLSYIEKEYGTAAFVVSRKESGIHIVPDKYKDIVTEVLTGNINEIHRAAGENLVEWRELPDKDLVFGVVYPFENFKPYLAKVRNDAIWFGILTFVFVTALALIISTDIAKPMENMKEKLKDFSLSRDSWAMDSFTDDESADLSAGFKLMTGEIGKQLDHSKMLVDNINLTVHHLSSSAGEMEAIAKEQAAGSSEQAAAIQQALTTAGEIAASARHISESTDTVESVTDETQKSCASSTDMVTSAIQGMDEVRDNVDKVAHNMLELGALSQRVGAVIDIIQEISEQTNLLSLNASIEASGAGEEGRRFAVVAREIRRLAEGTVDASRQIKQIIAEIRRSTTGTIVQVEESTKAVEKWAKHVSQLGESFQHIESMVASANSALREIKTNTRQQTSACEQLAEVIAQVKDVADRVVVSSKETELSMSDLTDLTIKLRDIISEKAET